MRNLNQTLVFYGGGIAAAMMGEIKSYMECRLCQNPTFHKDMILDGYLEKWMWAFTK